MTVEGKTSDLCAIRLLKRTKDHPHRSSGIMIPTIYIYIYNTKGEGVVSEPMMATANFCWAARMRGVFLGIFKPQEQISGK